MSELDSWHWLLSPAGEETGRKEGKQATRHAREKEFFKKKKITVVIHWLCTLQYWAENHGADRCYSHCKGGGGEEKEVCEPWKTNPSLGRKRTSELRDVPECSANERTQPLELSAAACAQDRKLVSGAKAGNRTQALQYGVLAS